MRLDTRTQVQEALSATREVVEDGDRAVIAFLEHMESFYVGDMVIEQAVGYLLNAAEAA